ncbi:MAG: hypothetical protein PHQ12_11935 [Chthoniobacteraceae bacterium]|nr:hypothetical protein [Chthoniobacteraceae bacterium]
MIEEIEKMLEANPFEPFVIYTSGGNAYFVASRDHAHITPRRSRVVIFFDDESSVTVPGLHIASVSKTTAEKLSAET